MCIRDRRSPSSATTWRRSDGTYPRCTSDGRTQHRLGIRKSLSRSGSQPNPSIWESNSHRQYSENLNLVSKLHIRKPVSYTHLRAHETVLDLVCRLLLEKKKKKT